MKRLLLAAFVTTAGLAFAAAAVAQQFKWVDQNGKVQYGDVPPPGVNAQRLRPPPPGSAPAPAPGAAAKKDDKGGKALSPEAAFRKRQEDAQKDREKEEKSEQEAAARKENCSRAQEQLRQAESGQRIARTDAKGDRYFLDESQLAQETSRLRGIVDKSCN
jgi:hypothetical protein